MFNISKIAATISPENSVENSTENSGETVVQSEIIFKPNVFIIGEEFSLFSATIKSSQKLNDFFKNPTISEKKKLRLLFTIFPGITLPFRSFLRVLTERSHLSLIPEIAEEYFKLLLEYRNFKKVKLITASILEDNYGDIILQTLKKLTDSDSIILEAAFNPRLVGGLIIEYKSILIDVSVLKEFSLLFNEI
uniref:ATP synthase CF1 delta subunit n=1 Tax=Synura uvella TaxID=52557 RepID=A0A3G2QZF1_9STRA|nr:ATP synthase CF1 delta subunit [Synura uvella]AYO28362.1 ATP synthase CF1 delta subunit [Synura uvella]